MKNFDYNYVLKIISEHKKGLQVQRELIEGDYVKHKVHEKKSLLHGCDMAIATCDYLVREITPLVEEGEEKC